MVAQTAALVMIRQPISALFEEPQTLLVGNSKKRVTFDTSEQRECSSAARALVRTENPNVADDPDVIVREFKERFYDTERFFDRFAKGRFARPLFDRHEAPPETHGAEATRGLVEEAQLFIDAVAAMEIREAGAQSALV